MGRARIFGLVDPMSEARDLLFASELAANHLIHALAGGRLAKLEQHLHHFGIRAAVERSLERADRGNDSRIDVSKRCCCDAPGKRRRVQLVIGMKRQSDIESAYRS